MRSLEIARTHEKLPGDLTTGEPEVLSEKAYPPGFVQVSLYIEPGFETSELSLNFPNYPCIVQGGIHFKAVADNSGITQESFALRIPVTGDGINIEVGICPSKIVLFVENRGPGQSCLIDLQDEPSEQFIVGVQRETVLRIVVGLVGRFPGHVFYGLAIVYGLFHEKFPWGFC